MGIFYKVRGIFNKQDSGSLKKGPESFNIKAFNIDNKTYDSLSQKDKISYISNWMRNNIDFKKLGINPDIAISGFIACWINESSLNRSIENQMEKKKWTGDQAYKYGRGIAQWSLDRNLNYKNWANQKYGLNVFASEDSIDHQLEFAMEEMLSRPALLNALAESSSPEEAADAVRRGFENGSANKLAGKAHMDSYTKVGSPGASAIYTKDTKQANYVYSIISEEGQGLMSSVSEKMKNNANLFNW